jgi:5-amino-6-(5-phosphoribosylamino)uracil reductase
MSADGKIADESRGAARFSSGTDLAHLEERVAAVDGVLFGGGTLRAYGTTLSVRSADLLAQRRRRGQAQQPMQIVWSPSGSLDPDFRFFRQSVPRGLVTTEDGAKTWEGRQAFDKIWGVPEGQTKPWDWRWILAQFQQEGFQTMALLGGGTLAAELFRCSLVDEVYLTVCPVVLGGQQAPTPVDGDGFLVEAAPRLQLVSNRVVGDEIYLHYRVIKLSG